jgi:hypothetical protein
MESQGKLWSLEMTNGFSFQKNSTGCHVENGMNEEEQELRDRPGDVCSNPVKTPQEFKSEEEPWRTPGVISRHVA